VIPFPRKETLQPHKSQILSDLLIYSRQWGAEYNYELRVNAYKYYGCGAFDIVSMGLEPGMPEEEVRQRLK